VAQKQRVMKLHQLRGPVNAIHSCTTYLKERLSYVMAIMPS